MEWMDIVSLRSIEEAAQLFSDTLHNTAKKCMPVKTISVRQCDKPWICDSASSAVRQTEELNK